jgi:hypothetical protein
VAYNLNNTIAVGTLIHVKNAQPDVGVAVPNNCLSRKSKM